MIWSSKCLSWVGIFFSLWVEWIWTPNCLVECCKSQGIHGVPHQTILQVLQSENMDVGQSWKALNSLREHGKVFYIRIGKFVRLFIADPVVARQILVDNEHCYEKPSFIRSLSILGDGVFSSSGKDWFHQRKFFEPRFRSKEIKKKMELLREVTLEAMHGWEQNLQLNQQEVNIYENFLELTLSVFGKYSFGSDLRSFKDEILHNFGRYLYNSQHCTFGLASRLPVFQSLCTISTREIKEYEDRLQRIAMDLLEKEPTQQHFQSGGDESLLASMLHLLKEEKLTEKQVIDNCVTFLLVGHETTATLLTWTVYLLSLHPRWQETARVEATQLWKKDDDALDWSKLGNLKTLNMILFEALRMYPPQPLVGRACVKENSVGKLVIPEKLELVIPISVLHYSKEYWGQDSEEFRPERFANGLSHASKSFTFLPFGMGPRTCIGQSFALEEARVVLAMMLLKFSWKISPCYRHSPEVTGLTLRPSIGMPIILEKWIPNG